MGHTIYDGFRRLDIVCSPLEVHSYPPTPPHSITWTDPTLSLWEISYQVTLLHQNNLPQQRTSFIVCMRASDRCQFESVCVRARTSAHVRVCVASWYLVESDSVQPSINLCQCGQCMFYVNSSTLREGPGIRSCYKIIQPQSQ